jgi:KaiC domain protein
MPGDRVSTGVQGLDEMLNGGVPQGHIVALIGSCGTGKTTLGMQFLMAGIKAGEHGMYISLEEDNEAITKNAASFGWDVATSVQAGALAVYKIDPADAKAALGKLRTDLPAEMKRVGAKRVVLDSISLLNMLFENQAECRSHLFTLCQAIKGAGATAFLTAEARPEQPWVSRDGLVEYVADGVIVLSYTDPKEHGEIKLAIRVMKMRRTSHSRKVKPYSVSAKGIEVLAGADLY